MKIVSGTYNKYATTIYYRSFRNSSFITLVACKRFLALAERDPKVGLRFPTKSETLMCHCFSELLSHFQQQANPKYARLFH